MKTSRKLYPATLASTALTLLLILISSITIVVTAQSVSPEIIENKITTSGLAGISSIYGDRIVWDDWRNKEIFPNSNGNTDIFMYNLSTLTETQITTSRSAVFPAIYEDRIVWSDNRSGNRDIYMYNLSTLTETQISANVADQILPDIYGNNIVWQNCLDGDYEICIYNLSTSAETQITASRSAVFPAIYENRVIWSDNRSGKWDIYMYDLSTSKETQISSSGSAAFSAIYGDRIVWSDYRNGKGELYLYNLSTFEESQITKNESAYNPAIYGDIIVWANNLNGNPNVFMYDLLTSKKTQISSGSVAFPAIYGKRIVWTDWRDGGFNIYMATFSYPPVAEFSAIPTSGTTPLNVIFTDKTTGIPTSWIWNFGDGSNSTEQNPIHTYSSIGNYTVILTASNAAGNNSMIKTNCIQVKTKPFISPPVAALAASPTSGNTPLNVTFIDKTTGIPTSWIWNFGDGSNSTLQNPTHTYLKVGNYTVTLTADNIAGSNTTIKTNYIEVTARPFM